jgi:hypothetical protein
MLTIGLATVVGVCGCAARTSVIASSTHGRASNYRFATTYVEMVPEEVFDTAVTMLRESGDIEVTDLNEPDNRCGAVSGDLKLTFRVLEATEGRSRLSAMVGGGHDPDGNQELADTMIRRVCERLPEPCETGDIEP